MHQTASPLADFSLAEIRHLVKDLFVPKPWIYWTDFLVSMTLGFLCFLAVNRWVPAYSFSQAALFVASAVLYYRATLFTHEMVHLRDDKFRLFRIVWNLLCGIPFLIPSFMYYTHVDHHIRSHYGTHKDGEYMPFGTGRPIHILLYLGHPFVIPLVAFARFLVVAPLCWFSPALRRWVQRHASSMVIDPNYIRPLPSAKALLIFRLQETACFLLTLFVTIRIACGFMPVGLLVQSYLTGVLVLLINNVRTLGAHRYISGGREMTFVEQLLDSVNYPEPSLLVLLWAPVGLRYHALHHLCPSLPYHALGQAHHRLMEQLPANSPYRQTNSASLWVSLRELWKTASQASATSVSSAIQSPRRGVLGVERGTMSDA